LAIWLVRTRLMKDYYRVKPDRRGDE